MCSYLENFIIGFFSGGLSSLAVTAVWSYFAKKRMNKLNDMEQELQFKADFFDDIQAKCKYLERIQLELSFPETDERNQNIRRMLEASPDTKTFSAGMTQNGKALLLEIDSIKENIKNDIKNNKLTTQKSRDYKELLFKMEFELLSHRTSFRRKWEDVKSEK